MSFTLSTVAAMIAARAYQIYKEKKKKKSVKRD